MRSLLLSSVLALSLGSSAAFADDHAEAKPEIPSLNEAVTEALQGAHRSDENKARDVYRNPAATLAFFELEPDMTVIEVSPGGGWYTEVLAPILREHGKLMITIGSGANTQAGLNRTLDRFAEHPDVYDKVGFAMYDPRAELPLAAPESVDMVTVIRHMHGLKLFGTTEPALKAYYDALKPGGTLAVVQHRWPADMPEPTEERLAETRFGIMGYMTEAEVIDAVTAAGFELVAQSEINANPRDTHDHPSFVYSLPPSLQDSEEGSEMRAAMLEIGESDRMTLKFVKPAAE